MKSLVKKLAAPLFGIIVIFNIYAQGVDEFITPYEIEQGQYEGTELYEGSQDPEDSLRETGQDRPAQD